MNKKVVPVSLLPYRKANPCTGPARLIILWKGQGARSGIKPAWKKYIGKTGARRDRLFLTLKYSRSVMKS